MKNDLIAVIESNRVEIYAQIVGSGPVGKTGERGPQGVQGDPGPQGAPGAKGDPGSDASVTAANIENALGFRPASETVTTEIKEDLAGLVPKTDYAPIAKTDDMTQAVGKDENGGLWIAPGGGLDPVDFAEGGNMHPITSNAVYTICGNINALLETI